MCNSIEKYSNNNNNSTSTIKLKSDCSATFGGCQQLATIDIAVLLLTTTVGLLFCLLCTRISGCGGGGSKMQQQWSRSRLHPSRRRIAPQGKMPLPFSLSPFILSPPIVCKWKQQQQQQQQQTIQRTRDSVIQLRLRLGRKDLPNANITVQPRRRRRRRRRRCLGGVVIDILCVISLFPLFCTRRRRRSFTLLQHIAVSLRPSLNPLKSSTSSCRLTFKKEKKRKERIERVLHGFRFPQREGERGSEPIQSV